MPLDLICVVLLEKRLSSVFIQNIPYSELKKHAKIDLRVFQCASQGLLVFRRIV